MRFFILLFLTVFLIGCSTSENPNTATNFKPPVANTATNNADNPLNTTKAPEAATTNNAPTLTPVVQAYYAALKTKNDAALKKIYSQETLKSLESDMKSEKKTSLVEFITDLEPVPDRPFEVRNEQIQGDTAVAEMRGGSYPNGIKIKFVRENGEWKMTNESPEIQSVKQSAANSVK
ncbi:MAG: nuclear transport factor 2 family protein [Acidobacteriota bacterium]|nr:nuclear transport factor 2 family protein [Acidobacteriota bacterium]